MIRSDLQLLAERLKRSWPRPCGLATLSRVPNRVVKSVAWSSKCSRIAFPACLLFLCLPLLCSACDERRLELFEVRNGGAQADPTTVGTEPAPSTVDAGNSLPVRPDFVLIDDFEDNNLQAAASDGWWHTINDSTAIQLLETVPVSDFAGSYFSLHTNGQNFTDWGAFVGLDLGSGAGFFDATPTTAIRFQARSATPREAILRLIQQDEASFTIPIDLLSDWTEHTVPFTAFTFAGDPESTVNPSIIRYVQLYFDVEPFEVWLDNVAFVTEP